MASSLCYDLVPETRYTGTGKYTYNSMTLTIIDNVNVYKTGDQLSRLRTTLVDTTWSMLLLALRMDIHAHP